MKHIQNQNRPPRRWPRIAALLLAALCGAAVMVVELGVARILTPVFGGSISVWAIVIATTMLALAAGYAFGGYRADRTGGMSVACRAAAIGAVLCALIPYARLPLVAHTIDLSTLTGTAVTALALIAPSLFFLSQVSPALIRGLTAESGGQVGDRGVLQSVHGIFAVEDTQKIQSSVYGHHGVVKTGKLTVGNSVDARVDVAARNRTVRNHSATHLMHKALREVLGSHVQQKGSLVDPDKTRFDFAHDKAMTEDEMRRVEAKVNAEILDNFLRIFDRRIPSDDPFKYIAGLDEKVAAWNGLIKKHQGTPYEFLARVEEERIDRAKVAFVEANRARLKEGNQLVIVGYSQLITKHQASKNIQRFLLDFGDFYMLLAKDYASQYDPEGLMFDFKVFDQFVKSALKLYSEVAQVDGVVEKLEAQGKIEATRGFLEKITRLNR